MTAPTVAPATSGLYRALGPVAEQTTSDGFGDDDLGYPLLRVLDGLGQIIQRVNDLVLDTPAGDPGYSILLDPTRCPTYALPWLAQWVGVRYTAAQATDAAQRVALTGEAGFGRGTPAALQAAIAPFLTAGSSAVIEERSNGDPYAVAVVVVAAQAQLAFYYQLDAEFSTYSALDGSASTYAGLTPPTADMLAALTAAKPAGLTLTFSVVTALPYGPLDTHFATYAAMDAAFASYQALDSYTG